MATWGAASEVFCDKQFHAKVMGKFYRIGIFLVQANLLEDDQTR